MVLSVCRNFLDDEASAEDAFQVTFLELARNAGTIRATASVGSWLYGVAYRTALKARADAARRHKLECRKSTRTCPAAGDDFSWREVQQILHAELSRFAERYRGPLVLCYLEGKTQDQAARTLGVSKATLKSDLERGRALLRLRLLRRGVGPAVVLAASCGPRLAHRPPCGRRLLTARLRLRQSWQPSRSPRACWRVDLASWER
jgi:RNA polymerase sigma factor (sigma-70 family)